MAFAELVERLPEWGRLFDAASYIRFIEAVREGLLARGEPFELGDESARISNASAFGSGPSPAKPAPPGWELPLLTLAQRCVGSPVAEWPSLVREELDRRAAEEKLGLELDALRGDFSRARAALKLRVQRAASLGPGTVSAPIAGELHAVLVLDLPSFVTPVRPADLAAWERPTSQLVRVAIENVKEQEQVDLNPMEIAGTRVFAVSGKSVFVATLGLAADDLLGPPTPHGALVAMPSGHIMLCHAIADRRSLRALEAMAAGSLQAFESGPAPLSPALFWKRGDRFVALPVQREEGEVKCELPKEFDEEVVAKL
jgi:hypothetical protein